MNVFVVPCDCQDFCAHARKMHRTLVEVAADYAREFFDAIAEAKTLHANARVAMSLMATPAAWSEKPAHLQLVKDEPERAS